MYMSESRHIDGKYSKKDQLDNEFPTGPTFGLRCIFVCLEIVEVSDQRHQAKKSSKDEMRGRDFSLNYFFSPSKTEWGIYHH